MRIGRTQPAAQAAPMRPVAVVFSPSCPHCHGAAADLLKEGLLDSVKVLVAGRDPEAPSLSGYPAVIMSGPTGTRIVAGRGPVVAAVREWAARGRR